MILETLKLEEGKITATFKQGKEEIFFSLEEDETIPCDSLGEGDRKAYCFLSALQEYALASEVDAEELSSFFNEHFAGRSLDEYEDPRGFLKELEETSSPSMISDDDDTWEDSWENSARHYASSDMAEKKG